MKTLLKYFLLTFSVLFFKELYAQVDIEAGKTVMQVKCVACHGLDGNTTITQWPKLAGQSREYLIKQLQDYKKGPSGPRYQAIMTMTVKNLSDNEIENVATYLAGIKRTVGATNPALVKRGRQLYLGGDRKKGIPACMACHSPTGEGNEIANFPGLNGQNVTYVIDQLKAFSNDKRKNDTNRMMRDIASKLTEKDMEAVAGYILGLHAAQ